MKAGRNVKRTECVFCHGRDPLCGCRLYVDRSAKVVPAPPPSTKDGEWAPSWRADARRKQRDLFACAILTGLIVRSNARGRYEDLIREALSAGAMAVRLSGHDAYTRAPTPRRRKQP